MRKVLYATSNPEKFRQASIVAKQFGITVVQATADVPEIQHEDGSAIALDKAAKVFVKLRQPIVVSDDSWYIAGLSGFPGPYAKYANQCFTVEDWLRLTHPLIDRRVTLRQCIAYRDADQQKIFCTEVVGELLTEGRGISDASFAHIISFDGGKTTIAEAHAQNKSAVTQVRTAWHDFCEWFTIGNA